MSAPATVRVEDALAPIREILRVMAADPNQPPLRGISPDLAAAPRERSARRERSERSITGWVPATALTGGDLLDDLVDTAREHWHATPHAAVALAWKSYSYWLALPAVLGYAGARRVPLLRPDAVRVQWSVESPFVRVALIPESLEVAVLGSDPLLSTGTEVLRVAADEDELLALLRASLIDDHFAPLVERLRARVHLGPRTLWGSVASAVAHALSRGADALASRATLLGRGRDWLSPTLDVAHQLLGALDLEGLVDLAPAPVGLDVQRRTCCLAFTLPTPKVCTGCPVPPG